MKTSMKLFASLLMISAISFSAQAKYIMGSNCGLIDSADDFSLSNEKSSALTMKSQLTALQKKQVIVAADSMDDLTAKEALSWLIESSEAGDVSYETGEFEGQLYDVVRYYPGGNPYGTVFKKGEVTPLAHIQDSDLVCHNER
jgi:hypothetical protein